MNYEDIKKLIDDMGNSKLTEISIDFPDGTKIGMKKEVTVVEKVQDTNIQHIDPTEVNEIVEPVEEWVEAYDKLYPYYVEMYKHLDTDLKALKNTVDQL